jgi:hypothetical protein
MRRSQASVVLHGPFLLILLERHLVLFSSPNQFPCSRGHEDNERERNFSKLHRTLC